MVNSSNEVLPLGSEALGQNSFERFTNVYQMPSSLAGRSVSHEEGLVAMALLDCSGKKPPSRSSGGRVDSSAWGDLLAVGGENVQDLALGGRRHPDGGGGGGGGGASIEDPKAQRQRQEQEKQQQLLEMEEMEQLANSMPKMPPFAMPPFGGVASSRSNSSSNSRSGSRKARLLSPREADWPNTSTDSGLNFLFYKSSSGSGSSSGGGGPPGEGGGRGATENAGGGRSGGSSGGGPPSWERAPYPGDLPSSGGAGGATITRDDVITNNCSSSRSNNTINSKFEFGQHPMRQPSFQPDREISDLPSVKDICPDPPVPVHPPATYEGVRDWQKEAAAAATITTPTTTSRSAAASVSTNSSSSSGVFVSSHGHANPSACVAATSACPPNPHSNHHHHHHHHHINADGPIAPAPARRVPAQPPATRPPAPEAQHERKPSYNLLAMMIPDISKFGKPTTAAPLLAPGAVPGAAPGGAAGFPAATGFAPAAAAHFSVADSYLRVGVEDRGVWTRQAALARYRRKKKRRHLVKIMRENDPTLQEQNEARKRPRNGGKFTKERPDFVSICQVQKAAKSRSISGELPLRERESATPPPQPSARRGAAATGRSSSARDKSRPAAGTRASPRGGGVQEGSALYMLTPSDVAKLGRLKGTRVN